MSLVSEENFLNSRFAILGDNEFCLVIYVTSNLRGCHFYKMKELTTIIDSILTIPHDYVYLHLTANRGYMVSAGNSDLFICVRGLERSLGIISRDSLKKYELVFTQQLVFGFNKV